MNIKLVAILIAVMLAGIGIYYIVADGDRGTDTPVEQNTEYGTVVVDDDYGTVRIVLYDPPNVTYQATSNVGYAFVSWQDGTGTVIGTDTTVTVDSSAVITAVFEPSATRTVAYSWSCPVSFSGQTVVTETVTQTVTYDNDDYIAAENSDAVRYATVDDPTPVSLIDPDDTNVQTIVTYLTSITSGMTDLQRATAILYWVQTAIDYETDLTLYGQTEYWATPTECLFNAHGDCEDTAVLFCSIAVAMGYDVALVGFSDHMGAAVVVDGVSDGQTYTSGETVYTYCETATDQAWGIGNISPSYGSAEYSLTEYTAEVSE